MTLAGILDLVAQVSPHFFNSFYRRVKVIRQRPAPMPPSVTLDITHRCALRCPFCIASDVLEQRDMPMETFEGLCLALRGVDRITLIGGEPAQHPQFSDMVTLARSSCREVEVFTNGLFLGADPRNVEQRIRRLVVDPSSDWLTLVLSADPGHAGQMGSDRLQKAIGAVLHAQHLGLCRTRFSVTHEELGSGSYVDADTVSRALEGVSPELSRWFQEGIMNGDLQRSFYFNSVICTQPSPDSFSPGSSGPGSRLPGPELLRLEDLLESPEVAFTFDREGKPSFVSSLASMWSKEPPGGTLLSPGREGAIELLRRSLGNEAGLAELAMDSGAELPIGTHPLWREAWLRAQTGEAGTRFRLLRGCAAFHRFASWDGGESVVRDRVRELMSFVGKGTGDRALQWGLEEAERRSDSRVLADFARDLSHAGYRDAIIDGMGSAIRTLFSNGDGWVAPQWVGGRELLGRRVPHSEGERFSLQRLHLLDEPGFTARDELVLRPAIELLPDARFRLSLPGIVPGTGPSPPEMIQLALVRLLDLVSLIAGLEVAQEVHQRLPDGLRDYAARPIRSLLPQLSYPDALSVYQECSFDRNRQSGDEDNPELLALALRAGQERFTSSEMKPLRQAALTWLERWTRRQRLTPVAWELLSQVSFRGSDKARFQALPKD